MTGRRPPLESITVDISLLTDAQVERAAVAAMRVVTRAEDHSVQRLYVRLAGGLADALTRRGETWSEFAEELAAIAAEMGEPGDR